MLGEPIGTMPTPIGEDAIDSDAVATGRHDRDRQEEGLQRRLGGQRRAATRPKSCSGTIVPDDMELVVTRNYGLTANEKVNELVEAWPWPS